MGSDANVAFGKDFAVELMYDKKKTNTLVYKTFKAQIWKVHPLPSIVL